MRIFSQLPDLPSASQRLACASVSPLSLPSVSRGLCALVSAHQATVYYCRAYVLLFRLTSHSASRGFCVLVLAHWPSLNAAGLMCSFGSPGPPFVPQGSCGPLSVPQSAIFLLPQSVSFLWAEKCSYLCFLPSKSCFAWLSEIPQVPLGPPCEGAF